mgnify:CR=1 FL=1
MLDGNLMDHVGRRVQRKGDAKLGKITELVHASYAPNAEGIREEDDMVFGIDFPGERTRYIAARSSVLEKSDLKIM